MASGWIIPLGNRGMGLKAMAPKVTEGVYHIETFEKGFCGEGRKCFASTLRPFPL